MCPSRLSFPESSIARLRLLASTARKMRQSREPFNAGLTDPTPTDEELSNAESSYTPDQDGPPSGPELPPDNPGNGPATSGNDPATSRRGPATSGNGPTTSGNSPTPAATESDGASDAAMEDGEGPFQPVPKRKRARGRTSSNSSTETVTPPAWSQRDYQADIPAGNTVLLRPAAAGRVADISDYRLTEYLTAEAPGEVVEIRKNRRKNVVAVDVKSAAGLNLPMSVKRACDCPPSSG